LEKERSQEDATGNPEKKWVDGCATECGALVGLIFFLIIFKLIAELLRCRDFIKG
jgi:hypothetical protein